MRYLIFSLLIACSQAFAGGSIFGTQPTGDPQVSGGVRALGMAGAGLALWDSLGLHTDNAAQLGAITGTALHAGVYSGLYNTSDSVAGDTDSEFGWNSFRLYFKLHPRYRMAIGVDPLSRADVRTFGRDSLTYPSGDTTVVETYEDRAVWQSHALDVRWDQSFTVSSRVTLGASLGFLSEHCDVRKTLDFPDTDATNDARDAEFHDIQRFSGYWGGLSLAAQPSNKLSIGAFWRSKASGEFAYERSVNHGGNSLLVKEDGKRAGAYGLGFGYQWHRSWTAYLDYRAQNWTVEDFGPMFDGQGLDDVSAQSVMFGVERRGGTKLTDEGFDRWDYRAGVAYRRQPWQVFAPNSSAASDVNELAISLGLSLPLLQQAGKLHAALEFGQRIASDVDVEELFTRFSLQVDLHERWFQREQRKLRD